jgi:hypothetical protein
MEFSVTLRLIYPWWRRHFMRWICEFVTSSGSERDLSQVKYTYLESSSCPFDTNWQQLTVFCSVTREGVSHINCVGCEANWWKWKDNYCGCWQNGPWEWQWAGSLIYLSPEVCFTALSINFGFDGKIFRWLIFISSRLRSHPLLTLCRCRNRWMKWGSVDLRHLQSCERNVTYVIASSTVYSIVTAVYNSVLLCWLSAVCVSDKWPLYQNGLKYLLQSTAIFILAT